MYSDQSIISKNLKKTGIFFFLIAYRYNISNLRERDRERSEEKGRERNRMGEREKKREREFFRGIKFSFNFTYHHDDSKFPVK